MMKKLEHDTKGIKACNTSTKIAQKLHMLFYYMDKGILLATKTLVEFISHYIRDLT